MSTQPPRRAFTLVELLVVIVILLVLIALLPGGESLLYFPFGWLPFLYRVVPRMRPAPDQILVAVVALLLATTLIHSFLRRVVKSRWWSLGNTLRVVFLGLLVFVAGTAFIGATHQIGWLFSSKEPWFERAWVVRINSSNRLKQMGMAIHAIHDAEKRLPAGAVFSPEGEPLHGWPTLLLPYLEQDHLFRTIDLAKPWDDPANAAAFRQPMPAYVYPGRLDDRTDGWPVMHYAANARVFGERRRSFEEAAPEGISNVIAFAEAAGEFRPWGFPIHWRDPAAGIGRPSGFGNPAGGGFVQAAMLDGSVRTFSAKTDDAAFRAAAGGRR